MSSTLFLTASTSQPACFNDSAHAATNTARCRQQHRRAAQCSTLKIIATHDYRVKKLLLLLLPSPPLIASLSLKP